MEIKNQKIVSFGEVLMRLTPEEDHRFYQADKFQVIYGGGEFNVLASLSNYGLETSYVTRLPQNDICNAVISQIRKFNVGTDQIIRGGDRLGVYFMERGIGVRAGNVIYDRANSSFSTIEKGMVNWDEVFKDASWFHWSGITPALSVSAAEACLEAVKEASKRGITVSADLNYRSKLWKYGKEPSWIIPELLSYSNVLLGDIDTALFMTGKDKVDPDYDDQEVVLKYYNQLMGDFPSIKTIATSLRQTTSASSYRIGGLIYDKQNYHRVDYRDLNHVVDRVGSGDAFMGGLIYGLVSGSLEEAIKFAVGACCLKHTIYGDVNVVSADEVKRFISADQVGKVDR